MENGLFMSRAKNKAFLILFIFQLFGCTQEVGNSFSQKASYQIKLENGTIVCRLGNGYFSNYFRLYASKEQRYSHIGIISVENDSLMVYHTEASELTGVGYVKRESLDSFLKGITVYGFYEFNYPQEVISNIVDNVKKYHTIKAPFDLSFDSYDDSELYCTELIARAINNSDNTTKIEPTLKLNGKNLFSLEDIYLNKKVEVIHLSLN